MNVEMKGYMFSRGIDIIRKLFCFFIIIGIMFFLKEDYLKKIYEDYVSESFEIYNYIYDNINIMFYIMIFTFIYDFKVFFCNSKYNKTKLEIVIYNILNKIPELKINYKIYTLAIIMICLLHYYIFSDMIYKSVFSLSLIAEVDYVTMEYLPIKLNSYNDIFIIIISSIFTFFIITKPNKKLNNYFIFVSTIVIILLISITKYLIGFNQSFYNIKENLNNRVVSINYKDYNYNTSMTLTHKDQKDDPDFEYLIESYAGQSMHNTLNLFDYIFSKEFKGDKERSYQLFAKIYNKNSIIMRDNEKKALKILNNGVSFTDFFYISIPYMIYEVYPYESTQKTIENILNKDYQASVDNYIKYILNNEIIVISNFTNQKRAESDFIGSPIYQSLIYSLVSNGYAKFDLEKVKNDKYKEMWKNKLQEKNIPAQKYSEEKVEKWFKAFGV